MTTVAHSANLNMMIGQTTGVGMDGASETHVSVRRVGLSGLAVVMVILGYVWFYDCSIATGCTTSPFQELQNQVVGNLVSGF